MKIEPLKFNYLNVYRLENRLNLPQIPYDSFQKVAFKGDCNKFIPAKTLDEAIEYGKSTFGIEEYKGFKDGDLDTLNWFNGGLYNLKNIMKNAPFVPPEKIICFDNLDGDTAIEANNYNLFFSRKCFDDDIEFIKREILSSNLSPEEKQKKLSLNLTFLSQEYDMNFDGKYVMKSPFSLVYHEMGHIQHAYSLGRELFKQITKYPKSKLSKSIRGLVNMFNQEKKTTASKVSNYATENVIEFVAETFAGLCEGVEYNDKVMDLYSKLGGVRP